MAQVKSRDQVKSDFAERLHGVYSRAPQTHKRHGKYVWVKDRLSDRGVSVTAETVRRWFSGIVMPRPEPMQALASVLGVDPGYLAHGTIGSAKTAGAVAEEVVYEEAEANRNSIGVSYILGRLGFMGLDSTRVSSCMIEVKFSSMRRAILNVCTARISNNLEALFSIPEPDRLTGKFRPTFIVLPDSSREPSVYFLSGYEAEIIGSGEKSMKITGERVLKDMQNNNLSILSKRDLLHVIKMI